MLKSANRFGFFLMASLIMLSVSAALIGNMNLFSDAMASGKHSDKNDNYQEYENYYSQDNQYTPDYNYNYEPMKQQQHQSSYDYNNEYGYDNHKQISYSDSYEDMKKYSTYPTKDKKYVCQTGQFKGFFVESVEFCKLKIAQGPAGPQGIQGPPGPSGISQINSTNLYQVVGNRILVNASLGNSEADCDAGDIVIEGGYHVFSSNFPPTVINDGPIGFDSGYFVSMVTNNQTEFQTFAWCLDNPPPH